MKDATDEIIEPEIVMSNLGKNRKNDLSKKVFKKNNNFFFRNVLF